MTAVNGIPEVPANVKRNVRAVLLSKAGGVLVSDFLKDYKALLKESLFIKDLGFESISEFIKALPDVIRLQYDDRCMAHRLYGIGDPSTYMSLSAKNAEKPKDRDRDRGRNRDKGSPGGGSEKKDDSGDDQYSDFLPNARGLYTLCYPRRNKDETEDDIREKFSRVCDLDDVNMIERMVFVRFRSKEMAIRALDEFKSINIRIADEKGNKNKTRTSPQDKSKSENNEKSEKSEKSDKSYKTDRSDQKKDGGRRSDRIEVYLGNLSQDATQEDIEELVSEFSPQQVRVKRVASDPRKVFAFVEFGSSDQDKADDLVQKLNRKEWMGRNIQVRLAHETREKRDSGPNTAKDDAKKPAEKKWPKSDFKPSSNVNNNANTSNNAVTSLDDDEWDNDTEEKGNVDQIVNSNISVNTETPKTSGSIWATTGASGQIGGSSPLKSPILEQSYTRSAASPVKQSKSPVKTGSQDSSMYGQNHPVQSQIFTKSPVKTEQDLLVESMTSFLKSPEKPQNPPTLVNNQSPLAAAETRYVRSPVKTETGMQITIQQSPHKRNLFNDFAQLEINNGSSNMKMSPSPRENPAQQYNGIANTNQPEDDYDEMPVLEPSVADPMPPLVPSVPKSAKIFVSNFPYGSSDEDLFRLFYDYRVININVGNRNLTSKSTHAVITLQSVELAELAIANLNQIKYMGRRLLVMFAKENLESRKDTHHGRQGYNPGFSSDKYGQHRSNERYLPQPHAQKGYNGKYTPENYATEGYSQASPTGPCSEMKSSAVTSPASSTSSLSENKVAFKSWYAMLQTFKIVMTKLGGRVRDITYKPQERLTVFVTSIFDEHNFWGQVIEEDATLQNLENVMQALQLDETRTGPTKGLGRCAAKYDDDWYRGWIIAEKGYNITVFYVDYGNIATIPKNSTSLTCPDLWEHKPALRPFKLTEGSAIDLKQLESQLVTLQVVKTRIEDTGYLIEVIVTSQE